MVFGVSFAEIFGEEEEEEAFDVVADDGTGADVAVLAGPAEAAVVATGFLTTGVGRAAVRRFAADAADDDVDDDIDDDGGFAVDCEARAP